MFRWARKPSSQILTEETEKPVGQIARAPRVLPRWVQAAPFFLSALLAAALFAASCRAEDSKPAPASAVKGRTVAPGVLEIGRLANPLITEDRKSTRLNSSHRL